MQLKRLFVALVAVLCATGAFAQGVQTASISGIVTGPDGGALPGVTVTATSPAQLGEPQAVTGSNGEYIIRALTPGHYTVKFMLDGMQTQERKVEA